jgi:GNAT superfamily N-acetyltransferase
MARADLDSVRGLSFELGYPVFDSELEARFRKLQNADLHRLLVYDDGKIQGWIHLSREEDLTSEPAVQVKALVVHEGSRGKGVGTALLAHAETWAREIGLSRVYVRSSISRTEAHAFYLRRGYPQAKTSHLFVREL